MDSTDIKQILEILEKGQSVYLNQINNLISESKFELIKAQSNLAYLKILIEPCIALEESCLPSEVPPQLFKIMHLIRVIWECSEYYNTKELITGLFRKLSNLIIIFCRNKIDIERVVTNEPRYGIELSNMSIDCCLAYKEIYKKIENYHLNLNPKLGWDLDYQTIFNQVDAFIQRLYDLIEICESMIVFGRCDEKEAIPKPLFGGIRGKEFEKICHNLEFRFHSGLDKIRNVSSVILEVHNNAWYEDIAKFRQLLRELEEVVQNLFSNVFLCVGNIEEGLEALYALTNFQFRKSLRTTYIRKVTDVWQSFIDEIAETNKDILSQTDERPAFLPKYGGKAVLLRIKLDRLTRIKKMLEQAEWLPETTNSSNAITAFNNLKTNTEKRILKINEEWLDNVGENLALKLNRPLMCRSVSHRGLLECNIDRDIPKILEDAKYFELLAMPCPASVNHIYSKASTIKFIYESVITVVIAYNRIISALSDKERVLFKALISVCERKINPGIYKLTWGGELSDQYIAECVKHTGKLQQFVDIFKVANLSVVRTCEEICDTPILKIITNHPVNLIELESCMEKHRHDELKKIMQYYRNIIEYILIVYDGFHNEMENVNFNPLYPH